MYIVDGQVFLDITMGEKQTPFTIGTGNLEALHVIENLSTVPQMQMVFKDVQGNLNNTLGLSDGTPISVKIGRYDSNHDIPYYNFRVFSQMGPTPAPGGQSYSVNCILDSPKFIRGIVQKLYKGTSSDAIKQIASDCGLAFSGVATNDNQSWLPSRTSYLNMARKIANHGFVDQQSYMRVGLTRKNLVKYYNATALIKQTPKVALVMGDKEQVPSKIQKQVGDQVYVLYDYRVSSQSGLLNYSLGYGAKQTQQQLDGSNSSLTQVQATKFSNSFEVNKQVYTDVDHVRSTYVPPDSGNVHSNYVQALYQNQRIRSLFANSIEILIQDVSGLEIFDIAYLQIVDKANRETFTAYTGLYFVEAITGSVFGGKYYEKLRLVNTGKAIDPNGVNI